MGFRVVCISRTTAAGGEDVGQAVADGLGFRYVDEQIIRLAARQAQVDPALVAKAEHRQPLLQRLMEKMPGSAGIVAAATGVSVGAFVPAPTGPKAEVADLRAMIQATIHEVARAGQAVIVAHAASMALAGREGVLRVLITASAEERANRLVWASGLEAGQAEAAVRESDAERVDYFRRFYELDEELPTHYDLVLNTDQLPPEAAVAAIIAVVTAGSP